MSIGRRAIQSNPIDPQAINGPPTISPKSLFLLKFLDFLDGHKIKITEEILDECSNKRKPREEREWSQSGPICPQDVSKISASCPQDVIERIIERISISSQWAENSKTGLLRIFNSKLSL